MGGCFPAIVLQSFGIVHTVVVPRQEGLESFQKDGGLLFSVTVGVGDIIFCPSGWLFHELVQHQSHVFGLRYSEKTNTQ